MTLGDAMLGHGGHGSFHVEVREKFRRADLAGVVEAMGAYEIRGKKEVLGGLIKVIPCCAGVCELGLPTLIRGWDQYSAKCGIRSPTGVKAAVYVLREKLGIKQRKEIVGMRRQRDG